MRPRCVRPSGATLGRALALQSPCLPRVRQHREPGQVGLGAEGKPQRPASDAADRIRRGDRFLSGRQLALSLGLLPRARAFRLGRHLHDGLGLRAVEFVESISQPQAGGGWQHVRRRLRHDLFLTAQTLRPAPRPGRMEQRAAQLVAGRGPDRHLAWSLPPRARHPDGNTRVG